MMTNRDWLCLALRLLGIWLLVQAAEQMTQYVSYYLAGMFNFQGVGLAFFWLTLRTLFALILTLFAPAIATRFHPIAKTHSETKLSEFNESRALKIGIQLLAVYALLLAVQSGARVIGNLFFDSSVRGFNYWEENYLKSLLSFGFNLAFAAILILWNDRVITIIENFRYVAERDAYVPPPLED